MTSPRFKARFIRRSAILFTSLLFATALPSVWASPASLKLVQKQLDKTPPVNDTVADAEEENLLNALQLAVKANKDKATDILATVLAARDDATALAPTLLTTVVDAAGGSKVGAGQLAKILAGAIAATPQAATGLTASALQFSQATADPQAFTVSVVSAMSDGEQIGSFVAQVITSALPPGKSGTGFVMEVITKLNYKAVLAKKDDSFRIGAIVGGGVRTLGTDEARLELTQTAINLLATPKNKIALNIARFSTALAANPTAFAARMAEGRVAELQEQIVGGSIQATAQNASTAAAIVSAILNQDAAGSHQLVDKASFAAAAVSGITDNEPLAASLAKLIAAAVHSDPQKAAIAAAVINKLDPELRSSAAQDIATQIATLLEAGNQPGFARFLAALLPSYAGQITIGVAITDPAHVAEITAQVLVASKATIKNAAAIAAAIASATNIGAIPEIANAIALQFQEHADLARKADDIAKALAQTILAKETTLDDRAVAVADVAAIFASHIADFPVKAAKQAKVLKILKAVLKVDTELGFSDLVVGNFAKALKTLGATPDFLDKIQKVAFSVIKSPAIRDAIATAIEQVKEGTDPFNPGEINDPETPVVNG